MAEEQKPIPVEPIVPSAVIKPQPQPQPVDPRLTVEPQMLRESLDPRDFIGPYRPPIIKGKK